MGTKEEREAKLAAARGDAEPRDDDMDDGGEDTPRVVDPEARGHEEEVTVDLSEDDKDDDEPPKTRREKKQDRFRQNRDERNEFENLFQQEREQNQRLLAHLERMSTPREPQPADPKRSPLEGELESVHAQLDALGIQARAYGDKITPQQEADITAKARALRIKEGRIFAKLELEEREAAAPRRQEITPQEAVKQARLADLREEFEDVYTHDPYRNRTFPALMWAEGRYKQLVAAAGGKQSMRLLKQAMTDAQKEYGFRREVSQTQARKYAQPGRGSGGGGDDKKVTLSPAAVRMGNAAFSHIKDKGERLKAIAKAKRARQARQNA